MHGNGAIRGGRGLGLFCAKVRVWQDASGIKTVVWCADIIELLVGPGSDAPAPPTEVRMAAYACAEVISMGWESDPCNKLFALQNWCNTRNRIMYPYEAPDIIGISILSKGNLECRITDSIQNTQIRHVAELLCVCACV